MKFWFTLLGLGMVLLSAQAQNSTTSEEEKKFIKIFYLIYNQQFDEAKLYLESYRSTLSPAVYDWLDTERKWWLAIDRKNPELFKQLENALKKKLDSLSFLETENEDIYFLKIMYEVYLLRIWTMQRRYWKALGMYYRLEHDWKKLRQWEGSKEEKQIMEIFSVTFALSKKKFLPFSLSSHKEEKYQKTLEQYAASSHLIPRTLALYTLVKINTEVNKQPQNAMYYLEKLIVLYPHNKLFRLLEKEVKH